jgi:hypothetical protein
VLGGAKSCPTTSPFDHHLAVITLQMFVKPFVSALSGFMRPRSRPSSLIDLSAHLIDPALKVLDVVIQPALDAVYGLLYVFQVRDQAPSFPAFRPAGSLAPQEERGQGQQKSADHNDRAHFWSHRRLLYYSVLY